MFGVWPLRILLFVFHANIDSHIKDAAVYITKIAFLYFGLDVLLSAVAVVLN